MPHGRDTAGFGARFGGRGRYRYGMWHGGPDPLAPPYDVRAAVDAVGEEVLAGGSLRNALRDLLRRGPGEPGRGLDDLLARARRLRREAARRADLDGPVTRARAQLDQALAAEREVLAGRDDDAARFAEAQLDALPRSTARAVAELTEYPWASPQARQIYDEILAGLRRDVVDQRFRGLRDALAGQDPTASQALKDMLGDLNALLAKHARGEDTTDDLADFQDRHGQMFADRFETVDDLIDSLARRAAAAERLLRSMSPAQREELASLMAQALGDAGLAAEMAALDENLRALRPDLSWTRRERAGTPGRPPMGYGEVTGVLEDLADLDDLVDQLAQGHPGATLDDVDVERLESQLGRAAADDLRRLRELERELERQGWVRRGADGPQLAPKALRRLGQTALRQVFEHLRSGRRGDHDARDAGSAGELTGESRTWRFGDEQPLDVVRTVSNAVRRAGAAREPVLAGTASPPAQSGTGPAGAVRLQVEDFEVVQTERRSGAAVALCVDLSNSMVLEGRWGPMKQTALALSHLIETRYPQDSLQVIGFNRHARRMSPEELAAADPAMEQGTNLQHALQIAGRHVRRHPESEPVVLVVTDGEPTAHLVGGGEALFWWPPLPETVRATVAEVDQLTRYGAAINMFMLGDDPGLRRFVDAVARRNGGRVFTPEAEDLGRFVVADYLRARRGRRRG